MVEKVDEVADGFENGTHSLELQIYSRDIRFSLGGLYAYLLRCGVTVL